VGMRRDRAGFEGCERPRGTEPAGVGEREVFCAVYVDRGLRFAALTSPPGADPEDLAREAMVPAPEWLDRFDPDRGSADGWLWRIIVSRGRDALAGPADGTPTPTRPSRPGGTTA